MSSSTKDHPSYFPECWADTNKMNGLMSMIKVRNVNPVDYDRKMKFWRQMIELVCENEHNALFDLDSLKRRFRRGDNLPSSLTVVLEDMHAKKDVLSVSEWRERRASWMGWGVSQLSKGGSWLFGGRAGPAFATDRFIHLPTVKSQAERIVELYRSEFQHELEVTGEVLSYSEMYDKAKHILRTTENFDIVLEELEERGEVSVGQSSSGHKILKFKSTGSSGPARFTEADASVHDLRRAVTKLDREVDTLTNKMNKLVTDAKAALRAGDKSRSVQLMRMKKATEKQIADKDAQITRLNQMLFQLANSKHHKEVIDVYRAGTKAFKAELAKNGLTVDKVEGTMDDVHQSMDDFREIEDAIGAAGMGVGDRSAIEAELEDELSALLATERKEEERERDAMRLPDVPSLSPGKKGLGQGEDRVDMSIEARWARLKANGQ